MKFAPVVLAGIAALVLLSLALIHVPSASRAERAVNNLGFHDAHVVKRSYSWGVFGGCHENDITKFTVEATAADGTDRVVQVCAPILGGYTVRN